MTTKKTLAYGFSAIALIFEGFFGLIPFVQFILQLLVIAFAVYFFLSLFRREMMLTWKAGILQYLITMLSTIGFFVTIFLSFVGYHHLSPGVISDITLSNSGQEVVFIEMSHIATPEFYRDKQATIAALAASGYTILVEGVKPGIPENQALFDQSMGFAFTPTLYTEMANIIQLQSQDNTVLYAGISTGSLVSVDLSIDEIIEMMGTGQSLTASGSEVLDLESEIKRSIGLLSPRERIFIGWVGRGFLNWSLKQSTDTIDAFIASPAQTALFTTIIHRRNDALVEYIKSHPGEKIAIVYGAFHFNGVYEELQKLDPNWRTTRVVNTTPYNY